MAPQKSKKARGKARARRTSPLTPPTLTPPPTARRGRPPGAGTYSADELWLLLKAIRKVKPRSASDWPQVAHEYNLTVPSDRQRSAEALKSRFNKMGNLRKPTGNPEANRLHEEALRIKEDLDALEHTLEIDDSPVPMDSSDEIIDLSTSESEMEIFNAPAPTRACTNVPAPARTPAHAPASSASTTALGKRKAEPSPAFRAVARKVGSGTAPSRPAPSQTLLDTATAQIASVFGPANEDRLANHQREEMRVFSLQDDLRDLRAELERERERRFALERQLRDEEMRRLVEQQVQRQLHQRLLTHPAASTMHQSTGESRQHQSHSHPATYPPPGEAHPSWMPGPPPERSDASGSGGWGFE